MATPQSPSVIALMASQGAIPLPAVAAQGAAVGGQPPVNPVSPVSVNGIVQAAGGWAGSGTGKITNPGTGMYQVTHSLGLGNHVVCPSVVGATGPCMISVISQDANQFTVQILDGNFNPIALPWGFTLSTIG